MRIRRLFEDSARPNPVTLRGNMKGTVPISKESAAIIRKAVKNEQSFAEDDNARYQHEIKTGFRKRNDPAAERSAERLETAKEAYKVVDVLLRNEGF
jgi:hypothetical protein